MQNSFYANFVSLCELFAYVYIERNLYDMMHFKFFGYREVQNCTDNCIDNCTDRINDLFAPCCNS